MGASNQPLPSTQPTHASHGLWLLPSVALLAVSLPAQRKPVTAPQPVPASAVRLPRDDESKTTRDANPAPESMGVFVPAGTPDTGVGLGDGGLFGNARTASKANKTPGTVLTPGGVLVRVKPAGIKLDFPSGGELFVTPQARVHLRSGDVFEPKFSVLHRTLILELPDKTRLQVEFTPGLNVDEPFRNVQIFGAGFRAELWQRGRPHRMVRRQRRTPKPPRDAVSFTVLGRGEALYEASCLGPVRIFHRVLCAEKLANATSKTLVVFENETLMRSMQELPERFDKPTAEFAKVDKLAQWLAVLAPRIFNVKNATLNNAAWGTARFKAGAGFEFAFTVPNRGPVRLGLYQSNADAPVVEWTLGKFAALHLMRPTEKTIGGNKDKELRWYRQGIPLEDLPEVRHEETGRRILQELQELTDATSKKPRPKPIR